MKPPRRRRHRAAPVRACYLPLMANLYLVCTLLDMVFALGDFNSTFFVSGGGPAMSTEVLATSASATPSRWRCPRSAWPP